MPTDPKDIKLTPELQQLIAELADSTHRPCQDVLREAVGEMRKRHGNALIDTQYMRFCAANADSSVSIEEVRAITAGWPSLGENISSEREDRL